jgi:hypothetical protein
MRVRRAVFTEVAAVTAEADIGLVRWFVMKVAGLARGSGHVVSMARVVNYALRKRRCADEHRRVGP